MRPAVFAEGSPQTASGEIFGPVLSVTHWHDLDVGVDRANATMAARPRSRRALTAAPHVRAGHV